MTIIVQAQWDKEAQVWVAESEQVPGLITEAEIPDALHHKLQHLIPELLDVNQCRPVGEQFVDVLIRYQREDRATVQVSA